MFSILRNLFLLFSSFITVHSFAQGYFSGRKEWGVLAGASSYYGDIFHNYSTKHIYPSAGLVLKRNYSGYFSSRFSAQYLKISGTDSEQPIYKSRNLSFQTPIIEVGGGLEFSFRDFGTNVNNKKGTAYTFMGLNMFYFNPTRFENKDIKLRNLRTEGQSKYSALQPSVSLGLGYKKLFRQRLHKGAWVIGIEGNWRKTFTDNLDDVNGKYADYKTQLDNQGQASVDFGHPETLLGLQPYAAGTGRGDTHLKDWYYFLGLSLTYRFTPLICR